MCDEALAATNLSVSAISWWEIEMLAQKGRIDIKQDSASLRKHVLGSGLIELAVDGAVGVLAATLGKFHGDPADRIIAATTLLQGTVLVTLQRIKKYSNGQAKSHDRMHKNR